jgi:hypothetical protein
MVSGWEKARLRSFRMLPFYVDRHRKPSATSVPNRIPRSAVSGPLRCCSAFQTKNPKRGGKTRLGPEAERKVAIYVPPRLDRTTRGGTTPSRSRINVTGRGRGPESNALLWRIRRVVGLCWDAPPKLTANSGARPRRTSTPAGAAILRALTGRRATCGKRLRLCWASHRICRGPLASHPPTPGQGGTHDHYKFLWRSYRTKTVEQHCVHAVASRVAVDGCRYCASGKRHLDRIVGIRVRQIALEGGAPH